jgi:hypothetical protein
MPTSVADKVHVNASTAIAFEHCRWTRPVSIATSVDRFVFATRTIPIAITKPAKSKRAKSFKPVLFMIHR